MRDLATLQRRFHELVTAGEGTIDPGLLGGSRQLDVYADAYIARLHDVLADDHPKLRAALGDDAFRALATDYVRARPPTSFTLRDAGLELSSYLATRDDVPAWGAELAALERARVDVFDAPDAEVLSRADLADVPPERFPELALVLVPASVVVPLTWTVDQLWSAIEDGTAGEPPDRDPRTVLVWRRDVAVVHRTLDPDEAELVGCLVAPTTVAELAARLAERVEGPEHRIVELLSRWLDAGILARSRAPVRPTIGG